MRCHELCILLGTTGIVPLGLEAGVCVVARIERNKHRLSRYSISSVVDIEYPLRSILNASLGELRARLDRVLERGVLEERGVALPICMYFALGEYLGEGIVPRGEVCRIHRAE